MYVLYHKENSVILLWLSMESRVHPGGATLSYGEKKKPVVKNGLSTTQRSRKKQHTYPIDFTTSFNRCFNSGSSLNSSPNSSAALASSNRPISFKALALR